MVSDLVSALILAVVQGMTEWLPVSSSGHLVLFSEILGFEGGLKFEAALHFGTLMAVFVYFGREITDIIRDFFRGRWKEDNGKAGWMLIVASIPAAFVGFFAANFFDTVLSDLRVVAFGFGLTGLFMFFASLDCWKKSELGYGNAFMIGIAQALAIIPGISRSGSTIAAGVALGLSEKNAMKFAFLMSIPIVLGANFVAIGNQTLPSELIWATLVSFVVGLLTIHLLFTKVLVKRKNFRWFGLYCILLALSLGIFVLM